MTKEEVSAVLEEIGTLLELKGESPFRCNAYRNGARAIQQLEGNLKEYVEAGRLGDIPGIGDTLREKITVLVTTGRLPFHEELKASLPPALVQMLRIPGLGPKKIKQLYDTLKITDIESLRLACQTGQVAALKGFGVKSQQKILEGIQFLGQVGNRVRIDQALPIGISLLERIRLIPGVIRAELCGSLRRRRETAKDIDILASAADPIPVMQAFVRMPEVVQVVGQGDTKSSVVVQKYIGSERITLNADLRVVADEQFPFALHYFTGSKEHNIRVRQRAIDRGFRLNEYELAASDRKVHCRDESELFAALDLHWIPPELREDTGEIDAATRVAGQTENRLPTLIEAADIRGVFHNHSTWSDGVNTIEEMARGAIELGFEYLGIADHSQSLSIANGLSPARLHAQLEEIDALNEKLAPFRIFKGSEVDILPDGSLDFPDDVIDALDYVVASVHTHFQMPVEEMTNRIIRAMQHPKVTMLGHATGRLLLRREGYRVDLDRVLEAVAAAGKMIEINAQPMRLDLDWVYCKRAKSLDIALVINPDAHRVAELEFFRFGVDVARRGWLEKSDVLNTSSFEEVRVRLRERCT